VSREKAVKNISIFLLDEVVPCVALIEFQKSIRKKLEEFRREVFHSMRKKLKLKSFFAIENETNRELLFFDRVTLEFSQEEKFISQRIKRLKELKYAYKSGNEQKELGLNEMLLDSTKRNFERLNKHISFVRDVLKDYLNTKNMQIIYGFQKNVFRLTIVIAMLTFIMVSFSIYGIMNSKQKGLSTEKRDNVK